MLTVVFTGFVGFISCSYLHLSIERLDLVRFAADAFLIILLDNRM